MEGSTSRGEKTRSFASRSEYHRLRIRRSLLLVLLGLPLFALGLFLVMNNLPGTDVTRAETILSGTPTTIGAAALVFGAYGLVDGTRGALRKGDDAIDLELGDAGVTVRGGHLIPWRLIAGATAVQYINQSKVPLLWSNGDLNRALVLRLKERLDVPGAASKDGKHTVRIRLLRYPALEYQKNYKEVVAEFRSRRIQVVETQKHKQT